MLRWAAASTFVPLTAHAAECSPCSELVYPSSSSISEDAEPQHLQPARCGTYPPRRAVRKHQLKPPCDCAGNAPAAAPSKMFEPSRPSTRSRLPPGAEPPEPPKPSKNARRRGKGKGGVAAEASEATPAESASSTAEPASSAADQGPQDPRAQAASGELQALQATQ